jgi:hypothetical protein
MLFTSLFDFRKESIIQSGYPKRDKRNSSNKDTLRLLIRIKKITYFLKKEKECDSLPEKNANLNYLQFLR